ncbi:MAG: branched-chain amino acid ABC transporter permease [Candidatus Sumerlaeaceae bacterium]|nr:branched-chain amino acid ABC transporter permease [Candidatus Sumerlaeaceae bacterium]
MSTTAAQPRNWKVPALWLGGFVLFALFITLNKGLTTFLTYFLLGLPQGAVIALIAVGYSMVYGIIQLINFAHGEVFMLSTMWVLMLVKPPANAGPSYYVITAAVGIMFFCTAWVLFSRFPNRFLQGLAALVIGVGAALLNAWIMPKAGAEPRLGFFAACAVAIAYSCCLGVTMDLVAYRPLRASPRLIPLITAIGLSIFFQNFAQSIWGSANQYFPAKATPEFFSGDRLQLSGPQGIFWRSETATLEVSRLDVVIVALALALMTGLQLFVQKTRTGKAMRACAQDRVTASLMGIKVNNVVALTFALGAGLAALVAPLYVLRGTPISPQMGYLVGILAFSSAVLGGIGNITGAMLGGMVIGIISAFVPLFDALDTFAWFGAAEKAGWITRAGYSQFVSWYGKPGQYQLGVAYAFMILIIVFKPTGLLGKASAKRA